MRKILDCTRPAANLLTVVDGGPTSVPASLVVTPSSSARSAISTVSLQYKRTPSRAGLDRSNYLSAVPISIVQTLPSRFVTSLIRCFAAIASYATLSPHIVHHLSTNALKHIDQGRATGAPFAASLFRYVLNGIRANAVAVRPYCHFPFNHPVTRSDTIQSHAIAKLNERTSVKTGPITNGMQASSLIRKPSLRYMA